MKEARGDTKKVTKLLISSVVPSFFKDTSFFKKDFTCEGFFSIFLSTAPSGFEKTKVIEETESRPKTTGDINVSPEPTLGPSRTTSFSATVSNESVSYSDLSKDDTVGSDSLREEPTEKVPVEKNDKVDLDFLNSLIERSAGASSTQAPFVLKEEKPQKKSNSGVKNKRKKNGSKRNTFSCALSYC